MTKLERTGAVIAVFFSYYLVVGLFLVLAYGFRNYWAGRKKRQ